MFKIMAYVYDKATTSVVMAAGAVDAQFRGELSLQNRFARALPASLKANTADNNKVIAAMVAAEVKHVMSNTRVSVKVSEINRIGNGEQIQVLYDVEVESAGKEVMSDLKSQCDSLERNYIYDPVRKIFVERSQLAVVRPEPESDSD